jgi:hypothetical protein
MRCAEAALDMRLSREDSSDEGHPVRDASFAVDPMERAASRGTRTNKPKVQAVGPLPQMEPPFNDEEDSFLSMRKMSG